MKHIEKRVDILYNEMMSHMKQNDMLTESCGTLVIKEKTLELIVHRFFYRVYREGESSVDIRQQALAKLTEEEKEVLGLDG